MGESAQGGEQGMEPVVVDGGKGTVELRSDGVIHLIWEPKVRIEQQDAKAAMAAVNEIAGDKTHPMLVDMATTESVTRAARVSPSTSSRTPNPDGITTVTTPARTDSAKPPIPTVIA